MLSAEREALAADESQYTDANGPDVDVGSPVVNDVGAAVPLMVVGKPELR